MTITRIKIYGERNTGTNFLTELIGENLAVEVLPGSAPAWLNRLQKKLPGKEWLRDLHDLLTFPQRLGWKHRQPPPAALTAALPHHRSDTLVITLSKNPYSWLLFLKKRPYHFRDDKKMPFSPFIRSRWATVGREGHRGPYANAVDMWNRKNAAYLALSSGLPSVLNITYEQLLADGQAVMEQIRERLGISYRHGRFVDINDAVKKRDASAGKDTDYYRDYYLSERWYAKLVADDTAFIKSHQIPDIMKALGYSCVATSTSTS